MGGGERRVVVTGIGPVAPAGLGRQAFWRGMQRGETYATARRLDAPTAASSFVAEIPGWDPEAYIARKQVRQTDRHTHFALAAIDLAMRDAGLMLDNEDRSRVGVVLANTLGGMEFAERELYRLWTDGPRTVSAYQSIAWFYAASQGQITIAHHLLGFAKTYVGDRAGGIQALGHAYRAIREGDADVIFAGATEAPLTPFSMLCYAGAGLVNTAAGTPQDAFRPFDRRARGLVLGEGAVVLVLEDYVHAQNRHAQVLAEVCGYAETCATDTPPAHVEMHARQLARALALARGGHSCPPAIDYIHADGAASLDADRAEVAAIRAAFGERAHHIPVSVPKALIGDAIAAGSAFAAAITVLSIVDQRILPTPHLEQPVADLEFIMTASQQRRLRRALVIGRSTAGVNAVLHLAAPDEVLSGFGA